MKNYKKLHIVCPIFLTILLFILGIFCIFDEQISKTFIAQGTVADFTWITGSPDNATLYDATNTYDYGLFTYDEFAQIFDIPESIFNAFNGQYLKISIGKGLITYDELGILVARYAAFFEELD